MKPYNIPIEVYQDHFVTFRVKQYNLSGYTAKSQFRTNTADSQDNTLLLELSTANNKITITPDTIVVGDYFVVLKINSVDSLLLTPETIWDLFIQAPTGERRKLSKGGICYGESVTEF